MYFLHHASVKTCASSSESNLLMVVACSVLQTVHAFHCVCTVLVVIWQHAVDAAVRCLQQPTLQFCREGDV